MPALPRTDERIAPDDRGPGSRPVDLYLTDEVFLYRVVGLVARDPDAVVEVEDCYGLDVVEVPMRHLRGRRLRVVTPEAAPERVADIQPGS